MCCFALKYFLLLCKTVHLAGLSHQGDIVTFNHVIPLSWPLHTPSCSLPVGTALSPLAFWSSPLSVMDMRQNVMDMRQNGCFNSEIIASILFTIELIQPIIILLFFNLCFSFLKREQKHSQGFSATSSDSSKINVKLVISEISNLGKCSGCCFSLVH